MHSPRFPDASAQLLREMVERAGGSIVLHAIPDARVAGLPSQTLFTPAMWYRILLPELLPDVERVLYMDVDTIALDSLSPLWDLDLGDAYVAAVTNVFQPNHLHRPAELGLAGPEVYFNSGVLVLNLDAMRRDGAADGVREYALGHPEIEWPDQDALNVVLGERRLALHPRWNLMNSVLIFDHAKSVFGADVVAEAIANPAIRHFEGPSVNKPWHYLCGREMREVYERHRRATPWPDMPVEGFTARNVVRRLLRGRVTA
jgi:lipopolysaccharide biosynthesis glycosyltransferase